MNAVRKCLLPVISVVAVVFGAGAFCGGVAVAAPSAPPASASGSASVHPGIDWAARSGLPGAAANALQASIDRQIARYGGVQVSPYEISYDDGHVIMVFASPLTGQFPTSSQDRVEAGLTSKGLSTRPGGSAGSSEQFTTMTTSYRYGCPYGSSTWTCFYQNSNYNNYSCSGVGSCGDGGRLLQFQSCGWQSLATYGFSGQTSSWVNNLGSYVSVYDTSGTQLWNESPGGASPYVGSWANDRADHFWIVC